MKGNHDEKVERIVTHPESLYEPGKNYAYHLISADNRDYLKSLPNHIKLDMSLNGQRCNMVFAHSIDDILIDTEQAYILELMQEAGADMLFVGHSHKPYHRRLTSLDGTVKHIVNLGSVGKPKDGDLRACYVMLTLNTTANQDTLKQEAVKIEFRRVEYDVEGSAKMIENSLLPAEFAQALRSGK